MAQRDWQGTAAGVAIGIGIGVAVGILLAPESGRETRGRIVGTMKDGIDGALETGQVLVQRAQQTLDDARERVKQAAEAGEQAYQKAKSNAA